MFTKERIEKAITIFLEQNPRAAKEIENQSPIIAEQIGVTIEELRNNKANELFAEYAASRQLEVPLLAFEMTATSAAELRDLKLQYFRMLAETIGASWEEYVECNPHLKVL